MNSFSKIINIEPISKGFKGFTQAFDVFLETDYFEKAYEEGVYGDTPKNRALGRVGQRYHTGKQEYEHKLKEFTVHKKDNRITFPRQVFKLLQFLSEHPDKPFTKEQLVKEVWKDTVVSPQIVDVYITKIRKKLGKNVIHAIKGYGYYYNKNVKINFHGD